MAVRLLGVDDGPLRSIEFYRSALVDLGNASRKQAFIASRMSAVRRTVATSHEGRGSRTGAMSTPRTAPPIPQQTIVPTRAPASGPALRGRRDREGSVVLSGRNRSSAREVLMAMHPERLAGILAALMWQRAHGVHCALCGARVRTIVVFPGSAGWCPVHEAMLSPEALAP